MARQREAIYPLTLDQVSYVVDGKPILRDINLRLEKPERVLVLGANGAGKSVLLRLMHGLVEPTTGRIVANGLNTTDARLRDLDAMLFQRPSMLRRSALENVVFGIRHARHAHTGASFADREAASRRALQAVGLAELAARPARVLSGGEQQRVALARALVRVPLLLYLDEPTASLDPASARLIESLVIATARTGVGVVMTSHNLAQAKRMAERVIFLTDGRITEDTVAQDFFKEPRSAEARAFLDGETI